MARDVNPEHILTFKLKTDGTVSGTTPINNLEGTWSTEGSSITILLGERKNTEVADDQAELLMADFSMGTALVEARTFLLSDEATVLSLFDASGRMVLCAQAVK